MGFDPQDKQPRKKKNRRKQKKEDLDDENLFLESCIAENKQLMVEHEAAIDDKIKRTIDLY